MSCDLPDTTHDRQRIVRVKKNSTYDDDDDSVDGNDSEGLQRVALGELERARHAGLPHAHVGLGAHAAILKVHPVQRYFDLGVRIAVLGPQLESSERRTQIGLQKPSETFTFLVF